jgi:hypothetical protein
MAWSSLQAWRVTSPNGRLSGKNEEVPSPYAARRFIISSSAMLVGVSGICMVLFPMLDDY